MRGRRDGADKDSYTNQRLCGDASNLQRLQSTCKTLRQILLLGNTAIIADEAKLTQSKSAKGRDSQGGVGGSSWA